MMELETRIHKNNTDLSAAFFKVVLYMVFDEPVDLRVVFHSPIEKKSVQIQVQTHLGAFESYSH